MDCRWNTNIAVKTRSRLPRLKFIPRQTLERQILDLHFLSEGKEGEYGPMRLRHTLAALLLITSRLQRKDITGKAKNERRRMTSLESSRFDTREESPPVSA